MPESNSEQLLFRGKLQLETTLGALASAGANPVVQRQLQDILYLHEVAGNGESQEYFAVAIEVSEAEKADTLASLEAYSKNAEIEEGVRLAAQSLREIL